MSIQSFFLIASFTTIVDSLNETSGIVNSTSIRILAAVANAEKIY